MTTDRPVAIVLGITADIGRELALRLIADGWFVIGLGRELDRVAGVFDDGNCQLLRCDLTVPAEVDAAAAAIISERRPWSLFVSSAGTMEPIGPFFTTRFDEFEQSFSINLFGQLRLLHGVWNGRDLSRPADVMLMAGGGTNNPVPNFTAYTIAKIALIKICEQIHAETDDINAFIIGPGYTRTRIHEQTLQAGERAGQGYARTRDFIEDESLPGTSFEDIYQHMQWCRRHGRPVAGGRNFSTVHDPWRGDSDAFADSLADDPDLYRLRRHPFMPAR